MIEPRRGWWAAQARLERETDPRRRQVLEVLVAHLKAEATVDFDLLLSTLASDPQYKFWVEGSGFGAGPRGLDAVVAHYQNLYRENRHVCEWDIQRIVVDDDCIVTEGPFIQLYPGWVLKTRGVDVDDDSAVYAVSNQLTIFWPFDKAGKLIGEDSYTDGQMFSADKIRKLAPEEVPELYYQTAK